MMYSKRWFEISLYTTALYKPFKAFIVVTNLEQT